MYFDLGVALMTMVNIEKLADAGHTCYVYDAKGDLLQKTERAIDLLCNAVRLLPDSDTAVYALCEELERLGRYDEALSVLHTFKKFVHPENRFIYCHLGRVYGRQGNWKKAYANYTRSILMTPPNPREIGYASMNKRCDQITSIRKRAVELDPESHSSFLWLGAELYKADCIAEAIAVMGTAALMQPGLELYMMISELHTSQLDLNEAIDNCLEGIRVLSGMCPPADMAPLYEALVMNLADCNRASEAKKYASEAVLLGADGPKLHTYLALAMDPTDDFNPLEGGWTSPSYVGTRLRIEMDGKIVSA